jgi:hypothetical protein
MQAKRRLPTLPGELGNDKTASASIPNDQLVQGPYRDAGDAKLKRKRDIETWLSTLDEAETMRAAMLREHALLEESVELDRRDLLARIRIKTPCRESWDAMRGSASQRHCDRCRRDVYDLSEMTRTEVEALFAREAEVPCVRLRLRPDGRVATTDCPVEPSRMPLMMSAVAGAMSAAAVSGAVALACMPQLGGVQRVDYAEERSAFEHEIEAIVAANARANEEARAADRARAVPPYIAPEDVMQGTMEFIDAAPVGLESERIGHHEYIVSRSFLERLIRSETRLAQVMPHEQNGVVFGLRIFGLERRGPLEQLGLRNGDVPLRVNGTSLSAPEDALEAVRIARTSNAVQVDILRAGRVITLRYTLLG